MSQIFISFAPYDRERVVELRDWLRGNGWDDVFIDLDPDRGVLAGDRWQHALLNASRRAEVVIACLSPRYLASKHSQAEIRAAELLGKRIIPVSLEPIDPVQLIGSLAQQQVIDLTPGVGPDEEGLRRLSSALREAGLSAVSFPANPARPPFRGLLSFEEQDAGIFFGRDAEIVRALDGLRILHRNGGGIFLIVGAAGVGKTSLLRAGLLPRLKRETGASILPAAFSQRDSAEVAIKQSIAGIVGRETITHDAPLEILMRAWAHYVRNHGPGVSAGDDRFILVIDQLEQFLQKRDLWHVVDCFFDQFKNATVIAAIRSADLALYQSHPQGRQEHIFSLEPLSQGAFRDVIEKPLIRTGGARVEPALVEAIVADAVGPGALPAVEDLMMRLWQTNSYADAFTLAQYHALGGLSGLYVRLFDELLNNAALFDFEPREQRIRILQSIFVPALVHISEDGDVRARYALLEYFNPSQRRIIDALIDNHLLTATGYKTELDNTVQIAVAGEIILTQVPLLRDAIDRGYNAIRTLDSVRLATADWRAHSQDRDYIVHTGERLRQVLDLLATPEFAHLLQPPEKAYLAACDEQAGRTGREPTNVDTEIRLLSQSVAHMRRTLDSMSAEYSEEERKAVGQVNRCLEEIASNISEIKPGRSRDGLFQRLKRSLGR